MQRKIIGLIVAVPLLSGLAVPESWARSESPQMSDSGVFLSAVADARLARQPQQFAPLTLAARQKQDRCYRFGVCDD
ncbi:MAG: hypothetical protein MUC60_02795 [Oscillatoria sp. Prado101]|jgi:hypothetical protein|nr:hypothetical protein [Oscillatoria sp. Prado101]